MSVFRPLALSGALLGLTLSSPGQATSFQDIASLEMRLIGALGAGIGETGGPVAQLDRRLKLQPCPETVKIDPPMMGAIALRCQTIGWRIRVPLVALPSATTNKVSGYAYQAPAKKEMVIKRGDPVELYTEQAGLRVSTQTYAQEDAGIGDRVRTKADAKASVIIAEVVDIGLTRLPQRP